MAPWLDAFKRSSIRCSVPSKRPGCARVRTRALGRFWLALACIGSGALLCAGRAHAKDMDLALGRLSRGDCARTLAGADDFALRDAQGQILQPDGAAFAQVVSQLSAAIAPALLSPVTTRGPLGFDVGFETSVTGLDAGAEAWRRGSAGSSGVATCDGRNDDVASALALNRVRFTKGLPLGVSFGASVGKLYVTSLATLGAELKLALIEGLTQAWAPALGIRVASSSVIGDAALSLHVLSTDLVLSKEWLAGSTLKIAPYLGLGVVYGRARAGVVDLTPNVDALACAAGADPVCNAEGLGASRDDFGHDRSFAPLSLVRQRGVLGTWLRYGLFALSTEVVLDLMQPRAGELKTPRQWGLHVAPSLSF
jgi:hypothetical protein